MRKFSLARVVLALMLAVVALVFRPHGLGNWLFLGGICFVLVVAVFASSWASWGGRGGGLHFGPRRKLRREHRPDDFNYPDARR